jgi:aminoglycoside phosphotransferase family enzyme/predicted kinase
LAEYPSRKLLETLVAPDAYPGDPSPDSGVEWVQTHLSHVFLTRERVYKFRKPVDLGFVRFASRGERNADCLREVALNRRLAPDVYLGVAPLRTERQRARVGAVAEELVADPGAGEAPEHCVVMRRLPPGRDALTLLEGGRLRPEQLDQLAVRIAAFHRDHGLGVPAPFDAAAWRERCTAPVEDNFRLLADSPAEVVPRELLDRARAAAEGFVAQHAERFEERRLAGRAVDGHGDLHLQHVWFEHDDAPPLVIDCLEFNERLRRIDAAAEVAFPAMDLAYRGEGALAERFLGIYAGERDDFDLYRVVDYFSSYRAAVRAKVAALAAHDPGIEARQREHAAESALRHLELSARLLASCAPGALVLVGGAVGTGKSTVAAALAETLQGVVVRSDRLRKHLAGLAPTESPTAEGARELYGAAAKDRVYRELLARARPVLSSGRIALLDATWSRRAWRDRARELARELGVPILFVEVRCPPDLARERLARREEAGDDASDAGPALHQASVAAFEAFREMDEGMRCLVRTDTDRWREELDSVAAALRT